MAVLPQRIRLQAMTLLAFMNPGISDSNQPPTDSPGKATNDGLSTGPMPHMRDPHGGFWFLTV